MRRPTDSTLSKRHPANLSKGMQRREDSAPEQRQAKTHEAVNTAWQARASRSSRKLARASIAQPRRAEMAMRPPASRRRQTMSIREKRVSKRSVLTSSGKQRRVKLTNNSKRSSPTHDPKYGLGWPHEYEPTTLAGHSWG